MFKIISSQVVRLASLCAILFVASSLPTTRRIVRLTDCLGERATGDGPIETSSDELVDSAARARTQAEAAANSQRRHAGKIRDLTETEARDQNQLLAPRRSSSPLLLRLLVGPPQRRSGRAEHQARVESAEEPARSRRAKCTVQRRFGEVFRGARGLLSGGLTSIEQRAGGLLYWGSNLLAALIPLASLVGLGGGGGGGAHVASPNATSANASSPSLLSQPQKLVQFAASSGGVQSRVEYVMDLLERSIEHLPNFPRLHPQECVKRSICEAHFEPAKYGAIGLTLRLLFPASNLSASAAGEQDNTEFKVINKYRHAAGYGALRRLDSAGGAPANVTGGGAWSTASAGACREKYEDCLVSLLDVAQKLVDVFVA